MTEENGEKQACDKMEANLAQNMIRVTSDSTKKAALGVNWPCNVSDCKICSLESYMDSDWAEVLKEEFKKDYFISIKRYLHGVTSIYPPLPQIFNFSKYTAFRNIKVVIIGQDPYHNPGQAMGLSFSVPRSMRIPPSLRNIYSELKNDINGFEIPKHGDLTSWAAQGVLLLNDTLTVSKNMPASHSRCGWATFTTKIIDLINEKLENVVFILWGENAKKKAKSVDKIKHLVLESGHPSPMSVRLFQGCKHFSKANEYLTEHGKAPIDWRLPN